LGGILLQLNSVKEINDNILPIIIS